MSYLDIENLYKAQAILLFKECFATEKIHGTSAHISWNPTKREEEDGKIWREYKKLGLDIFTQKNEVMQALSLILSEEEMHRAYSILSVAEHDGRLSFFAGGAKHQEFVSLFDASAIANRFFDSVGFAPATIYGEAYGGKMQGMSAIYGNKLRFVAFEVRIGEQWLSVPKAEAFVSGFNLDFVPYKRIPTTLEAIDVERDADSIQAVKNGMGEGHKREGVVLRPIEEFTMNNGSRVIAKHKRDEFMETKTHREVNPEKLKVLQDAKDIVNEWVTLERLNHILTSGEVVPDIKNAGTVIQMMIRDIHKEAVGEIVETPESNKEVGRATALLFKQWLNNQMKEQVDEASNS